MECKNHKMQFVKYLKSNNSIAINKQCFTCGELDVKMFAYKMVENIENIPFRDLNLYENWKNNKNLFFEKYENYLNSDSWKNKRIEVLRKYKNKCVLCFASAEVVHHLHYARLFEEKITDLIPLCNDCHDNLHNDMRGFENLKNTINITK